MPAKNTSSGLTTIQKNGMGMDLSIPPPTPISIIQNIGANMCDIPPQELSPKKLLASLQEGSPSPKQKP